MFGLVHSARQPVKIASGQLATTDSIQWTCGSDCRVHVVRPAPPRRRSAIPCRRGISARVHCLISGFGQVLWTGNESEIRKQWVAFPQFGGQPGFDQVSDKPALAGAAPVGGLAQPFVERPGQRDVLSDMCSHGITTRTATDERHQFERRLRCPPSPSSPARRRGGSPANRRLAGNHGDWAPDPGRPADPAIAGEERATELLGQSYVGRVVGR